MHVSDKLFSSTFINIIEQNIHLLLNKNNFKIADRDTYVQANHQLKYKNSIQDIANFLNDLVDKGIFPNIFVLNQLMEKLFRVNQVNLARKIFKLIKHHQLCNSISYNTLLSNLSKKVGFSQQDILEIFNEAKQHNYANSTSFNTMIHGISKQYNPNIELAISIFEDAKALGFANLITYSNLLYTLSKQHPVDIKQSIKIFHEAQSVFTHLDSIVFANMLLNIAYMDEPDILLAVEILQQAKLQQQANRYTYANCLFAISKSSQPDIDLAQKILEEAKAADFIDSYSYTNTLVAIAKSQRPDATLILKLLQDAKQKGLLDTIVYSCALDALSNIDDLDFNVALNVFNDAKSQNMVNHMTYSSMLRIVAYICPNQLDYALQLFQEIKSNHLLDAHIYSNLLQVIASGTPVDVNLAMSVFQEAQKFNLMDSIGYANALLALQNSDQPNSKLAFQLYQQAKAQHSSNHIVATHTLKVFAKAAVFDNQHILSIINDCTQKKQIDAQFINALMNLVSRHSQQLDVKILLPLFFYSHLLSSEHQKSLHEVFATSAWGDFARAAIKMSEVNPLSLAHMDSNVSHRSIEMVVPGF